MKRTQSRMVKPKTSPVLIQRRGNRLEVENRETGDLLAACWIGDDLAVEDIADSLSARRLPKDAEKVRQILMDARKSIIRK